MVEVTFDTKDLNGLKTKIDRLKKKVGDLRPAFEQMAADFYKQQKVLFREGKRTFYEDLSETPYFFKRKPGDLGPRGGKYKTFKGGYKEWKEYYYGNAYPILHATGKLSESLLNPRSRNAIRKIGKRDFEIGTKDEKAEYHHYGTNKMPQRPLWQDPPRRISDAKVSHRMFFRWRRILDVYLDKASRGLL